MKYCICNDWDSGMKSILAQGTIASIHLVPYTGKAFQFCPWCGFPLLDRESAADTKESAPTDAEQLKAEILPLLNVAKEEFADGKYNHGFYYLDQAMAKLSAV